MGGAGRWVGQVGKYFSIVSIAIELYFKCHIFRQQDLRKVLKAFAHHNVDIGYCQVSILK